MLNDPNLNITLARLAASTMATTPDGFFDGVWQRVGQLQERADGRRRLALFCGLIVVGLGAGFGTSQTPAFAQPPSYKLIAGAELSPAALLHLEP